MAGIAANSYSEALFELGKEAGTLDLYRDELLGIEATLKENEDFWKVLNHPKIAKKEKKELLEQVYGKDVDKMVLNFLKLLIDKGRFVLFPEIVKAFVKAYNDEHHIVVAFVRSARALDEVQCLEIKKMLEEKLQKTVQLQLQIDESLLAGIRIKVDDLVIDNSASMRLNKMKEQVRLSSEK